MISNAPKLSDDLTLLAKLQRLSWGFIFFIALTASIGFAALYSAAGGDMDPWASRQLTRFIVGMGGMLFIALIDIRWWYKLAYPLYIFGFILLVIVELKGQIGMGAQRWINLGFIQLQPSEAMKIVVVLALAKYFHTATPSDMKSLRFLLPAAFLIIAPVALVLLQPDLGTSLMIVMAGITMFFLSGAPILYFIVGGVLAVAALPVAWAFMHDYQKQRVLTFLNPESDPLGSGYHIIQSKIAIGSGGIEGKGFLEGTQARLNFLPEKQTDFIFTLWVEEWGFLGGMFLFAVLGTVFLFGHIMAQKIRYSFGRLLVVGLIVNFSLYVFINTAMVMGLIPVVGAPLPMISYGGTSMLTVLVGFGLISSAYVHRDAKLPRM
ncbi:MAG: rod shape-determining protein RodA [Alphaproteobacteria bacterium]|nr:rod shape-determining protein RodA [Alphaproteobacteria bacterium]